MLPKGFKFRTWRYERFDSPTNPGSRTKVLYSAKYADDGTLMLEEVGTEDIYDYIQSFADSVDMDTIMRRYMNGDVSALDRVQGFYHDVSAFSKNPADLLNKLNHAESEFNKLPVEFKELYDNDFAKFICTFDPSVFDSVVNSGDLPDDIGEAVSAEVKEG